MGVVRWRGDAPAVAQVNQVLPASVAVGNTFTLTINGKNITFTATAATVANVTAGLKSAVLTSTIPEFLELIPTDNQVNLLLTAKVPGVPFTQTSSASGGAATLVTTTPTASAGPNDWSVAANWSTGKTPQGACLSPVQSNVVGAAGGTLSEASTYYYVLTATNANGETLISNEKSYAPSAGNDTSNLSWAQVNGATGYKVYRGTTAAGENKLITTITSGATITFSDTGGAGNAAGLPVANTAVGDDTYIEVPIPIFFGLNQSTINLNSLNIAGQFTVSLGLPVSNPLGYFEYRGCYLQILCSGNILIGYGNGNGSGLTRLNLGSSVITSITILKTGKSTEIGAAAIRLLNTGSSNVSIEQGSLEIAVLGSETGNSFNVVSVGYSSNLATDVSVSAGAGTTIGALRQSGGNCTCLCAPGAVTVTGGTLRLTPSSTIPALNAYGGTVIYSGPQTITSLVVGANGTVSFSQDGSSRTVTNCTVSTIPGTGSGIQDSLNTVTFTNAIAQTKTRYGVNPSAGGAGFGH